MNHVFKQFVNSSRRVFYAVFLIMLFAVYSLFLSQPVYAENNEPKTFVSIMDSSVLSTEEITNKIKKVNRELDTISIEENKPGSDQPAESLNFKKERLYGLRELKSLYQQQIIALNRFASLEKEKQHLDETKENRQDVAVSQTPPFSLTFQDDFLDKLSSAVVRHQNISASLAISKKSWNLQKKI